MLRCKCRGVNINRHDAIRNEVFEMLTIEKEGNDLVANTQRRSDLLFSHLYKGKDMALDASIVDSSSKDCWKTPLAAGQQRERNKRRKYANDLSTVDLLVLEAFGA